MSVFSKCVESYGPRVILNQQLEILEEFSNTNITRLFNRHSFNWKFNWKLLMSGKFPPFRTLIREYCNLSILLQLRCYEHIDTLGFGMRSYYIIFLLFTLLNI